VVEEARLSQITVASSESAYPLTDARLARRLERAEAEANAAFVEARAAVQPEVGAAWMELAGVYAMFDGAESPLTQTFGLGMFDPIGPEQLDRLEEFFSGCGAPVHHEVAPLISPELLELLSERGYRPIEYSTVMVRPTATESGVSGAVTARLIEPGEAEVWAVTAGRGWSSESAEAARFVEEFGRVVSRARGVHCFLAESESTPIAAATLCMHGDVALLAGASTVPHARRRGAQRALFEARLRFAASKGVSLAMVVAQPGSGSQRNAERRGFRNVYTRTKWRLDPAA
jgi:GNAT superfamily N-acetyltransferase